MKLLAKPYAEYVGRSTTPLRAIGALLTANIVVPSIIVLILFSPTVTYGIYAESFDYLEWFKVLAGFALIGMAIAAPFVWILGGLIWLFVHGLGKNGPLSASISGFGLVFCVSLVATLQTIQVPSPGTRVTLSDMLYTMAGALGFSLIIALSGVLGGLLIWVIAYKDMPVRPDRDILGS